MPIARFNDPFVPDISPVTNRLGAFSDQKRQQKQTEQVQNLAVDSLKNSESFARLATIDPEVAGQVRAMIERNDAQELASAQEATQRIAKEASFLETLRGTDQDRQIVKLAQEAAQRGEDISEYQRLLDMDPADRAIEFKRDILQAADITKLVGQQLDPNLPISQQNADTASRNADISQQNADNAVVGTQLDIEQFKFDREKFAAEQAAAGLPDSDKLFNNALKLQDRFVKETKDFPAQSDSYGRIQASVEDPSAAGDLALIFNFMKLLDPGSTVREGEFATAQNADGVSGRIRSLYNRVADGERMNEAQRKDFVERADKLFSKAEKAYKQREDKFRKIAKQNSLDENLVVFDRRTVETIQDSPPEDFVSPGGVRVKVRG